LELSGRPLIESPTPAIALIAGPRHHYDTITLFQFMENIPDHCPLPKFFRALYSIRDDDVPQTAIQARSKKRERHVVANSADLGRRKQYITASSRSQSSAVV
jgi:hypothetical protein